MASVEHKQILNARAEQVWADISSFHAIERWFPPVKQSSVQGDGAGATRTCVMQDGGQIRERLLSLDAASRSLRYSIVEAPFPVVDYVATMAVRELADGRCEFVWSSTFEVAGAPAEELRAIFAQAYAAGAAGLEQLHSPR